MGGGAGGGRRRSGVSVEERREKVRERRTKLGSRRLQTIRVLFELIVLIRLSK